MPNPQPVTPGPPPAPAQLRGWQKISLTMWTAIAVLVVGGLAAIIQDAYGSAARPGGSEMVVVARGGLPALTVVSAGDVRLEKVAGPASRPGRCVRSRP